MRRAAIAIGCVLLVACALAQEGKHQAGKATPAPAAPTKVGTVGAKSGQAAPRKMGRRPAGEPPATPLVGWIEDRFDQIHHLAKVGAPGAFLAGVIGLYSFFRKPPEIKRQKIRWVHVITAIVFGLIAATHAVAFDTHHKIGGGGRRAVALRDLAGSGPDLSAHHRRVQVLELAPPRLVATDPPHVPGPVPGGALRTRHTEDTARTHVLRSREMARAKIGIVGLGAFGLNHLRTFRQLEWAGVCELVAGCDVNEKLLAERRESFEFAPYTDFHEMLAKEELDGVTVVTPDPYHRDIVLAAAEAGVHVLCEKPLDVTVEGCVEMIGACEKRGPAAAGGLP